MAFGFGRLLQFKHWWLFYLSAFILFLIFSPSDVRCLKGRDNPGGEGLMQMERSTG